MLFRSMETLAVIGAGMMGPGIAQVFATRGHTVRVQANLTRMASYGLVDDDAIPAILARIELTSDLAAACAGADVVIEAITEDLAMKQDMFVELERICSAHNMSDEMTPHGIRVNCVHPGLIDTDMTDWVMKRPDLLPGILAQISLGRAGEPREIGTVVAFFASDEASYLTGQSIHVDGGWVGK